MSPGPGTRTRTLTRRSRIRIVSTSGSWSRERTHIARLPDETGSGRPVRGRPDDASLRYALSPTTPARDADPDQRSVDLRSGAATRSRPVRPRSALRLSAPDHPGMSSTPPGLAAGPPGTAGVLAGPGSERARRLGWHLVGCSTLAESSRPLGIEVPGGRGIPPSPMPSKDLLCRDPAPSCGIVSKKWRAKEAFYGNVAPPCGFPCRE